MYELTKGEMEQVNGGCFWFEQGCEPWPVLPSPPLPPELQ